MGALILTISLLPFLYLHYSLEFFPAILNRAAVFNCCFIPRQIFFFSQEEKKTSQNAQIKPLALLFFFSFSLFSGKSPNLLVGYCSMNVDKTFWSSQYFQTPQAISHRPGYWLSLWICKKSPFGWQMYVWFQFAVRHFSLLPQARLESETAAC